MLISWSQTWYYLGGHLNSFFSEFVKTNELHFIGLLCCQLISSLKIIMSPKPQTGVVQVQQDQLISSPVHLFFIGLPKITWSGTYRRITLFLLPIKSFNLLRHSQTILELVTGEISALIAACFRNVLTTCFFQHIVQK